MFGCQDSVYRLLFQSDASPEHSVPFIVSADDLLDTGYNQLVYVTETCDVTSCRKEIRIWGWSLTLGIFEDLADDAIGVPGKLADGLGATVADTSGDNISEIVISGGTETSIQAGPPRAVTQVWAWNGEVFEISQTISPEATYRIHAIHDGDNALERGEFEQAAAYYNSALFDPELQNWILPGEQANLRAYTLYRLMLTHAVQYDQTRAGSYFDQLLAEYPPYGFPGAEEGGEEGEEGEEEEEPQPVAAPGGVGSVYAELAVAFWDAYILQNDHGLACRDAIAFAQTRPDVLFPLNSYGYANPHYTARDLCPFITQ
jgi:hypothetical protein